MQANRKMGVRAVLAAGGEGQRDAGTDEQGQQAHPKGGQQVVQNFHTELHTVGVHDHGGHHQIDQQVGKGLLALGLSTPVFTAAMPVPMSRNNMTT